jgi:hypothetical protein
MEVTDSGINTVTYYSTVIITIVKNLSYRPITFSIQVSILFPLSLTLTQNKLERWFLTSIFQAGLILAIKTIDTSFYL